jgi:hypothetical protein
LNVLVALLASLLIVFGSPYAGQLRSALQSSFPDHYQWIVGGIVAAAAVVATAWAFTRLRRLQRDSSTTAHDAGLPLWVRYMLIAASLAVGAGYARAVSSGESQVDVVEAFHFVEYGLVAYLFYRAWHRRPDLSGVLLAGCAGVAVGVADEWVQWFVPGRVGELHDVLLNAVAVGCGLLFSMAVHPPSSLALPTYRPSRLALGTAISGLLVTTAGFVDRVHLGYEVQAGPTAIFRSPYDAGALAAARASRSVRWNVSPPPVRGFTHEDHYMSEGQWHVQRRNIAVGLGDWWTAWSENDILERFYPPVLYWGSRWSTDQRSGIEQRARGSARGSYVSDAAPYPIYVIRRSTFWLVTVLICAVILWLSSAFAEATGRRAAEPSRV